MSLITARNTSDRATRNRAVRQDALRAQIAANLHHQQVALLVEKLSDPEQDIPPEMVARYKIAMDGRLRLLSKYLPDLKATELTGEGGGPVGIDEIRRTLVDSQSANAA